MPAFDGDTWLEAAREHLNDDVKNNLDDFVNKAVSGLVAPVASDIAAVKEEQAAMNRQLSRVEAQVTNV